MNIAENMNTALPPAKPLNKRETEVVVSEINRQKKVASLVRVAVGNSRTPEDYKLLVIKSRGDHRYPPPRHGWLYKAFWCAVGYVVWAIDISYRYMSAWNREG